MTRLTHLKCIRLGSVRSSLLILLHAGSSNTLFIFVIMRLWRILVERIMFHFNLTARDRNVNYYFDGAFELFRVDEAININV